MNQGLIINFYNVEHGLCVHMITPNNKHFLYDVGSNENESIVYYIKDKYNLDTIDYFILSHPHKDHFSDIINLHSLLKPKVFSRNPDAFPIDNKDNDIIIDKMNEFNNSYNGFIPEGERISNPINNGNVSIKQYIYKDASKEDLNTFSMSVLLEYAGVKVLLMGDNEVEHQQELSSIHNYPELKDIDFYLAPHHGRTAQYCKELQDKLNPRLTIISDKNIVHTTQEQSSSVYNSGQGYIINGKERYCITTRNDGNITLTINSDGKTNISFEAENYG